jgi:hypothetical protein
MEKEKLQTVDEELTNAQTRELEKKRLRIISQQILERDNRAYAGTSGISHNNRRLGFVPAYRNSYTDEVSISRFADGNPAPVHILDGLPDSWVMQRDRHGHVVKVRQGIVAGFLLEGKFYTREQAANFTTH